GGPERGAGPAAPRADGAGDPADLHAPARRGTAQLRGHGAALVPGQRDPLLLPLALRLLQPRRGDDRDAAAPARPRGPALLRDLPAVLPDVLHVLYGQAGPRRLDAAVVGQPRHPVPARGVPALLPRLPGAAPVPLPGLDRPGGLHAGPRARRRR